MSAWDRHGDRVLGRVSKHMDTKVRKKCDVRQHSSREKVEYSRRPSESPRNVIYSFFEAPSSSSPVSHMDVSFAGQCFLSLARKLKRRSHHLLHAVSATRTWSRTPAPQGRGCSPAATNGTFTEAASSNGSRRTPTAQYAKLSTTWKVSGLLRKCKHDHWRFIVHISELAFSLDETESNGRAGIGFVML